MFYVLAYYIPFLFILSKKTLKEFKKERFWLIKNEQYEIQFHYVRM